MNIKKNLMNQYTKILMMIFPNLWRFLVSTIKAFFLSKLTIIVRNYWKILLFLLYFITNQISDIK